VEDFERLLEIFLITALSARHYGYGESRGRDGAEYTLASQPGVITPNNGFIPLSSADAQPILAARQQANTPPAAKRL
jgi:hypothetical protein